MTDDSAYGMLVPIMDGGGVATRDTIEQLQLAEAGLEGAATAEADAAVGLVQHLLRATGQ